MESQKPRICVDVFILTTLLPETIVQITMPAVIINTDKYFEKSYRRFKIMMPITIFAINEPCSMNEIKKKEVLIFLSQMEK